MGEEKNIITSDEAMSKAFQESVNKSEMSDVLKELFDKGKIFLITDLSRTEITLATKIYMIAKMKKINIWTQGLTFFCQLALSKNRKSRRELLEAIKGYNNQMGMLGKMNPRNWGRM